MSQFFIVLTTLPMDHDAGAFARALIAERLAACVNVFPAMTSTYVWQGRVEEAEERQLVIKTAAARLAALERRIAELHPYEVPELLVLEVARGADTYLHWMSESIGEGPSPIA